MANIMLTKRCNLQCTYCFANEFVNQQTDDISFDDFLYCMRFLKGNPNERVGLIGGEPTMHPEFNKILAWLIDSPFSSVCIFSNGILLDKYFNELRNTKFQILVNVNSPESMGESNYLRVVQNIKKMVFNLYMRNQVGLSLNLHSIDQDYDYILGILRDCDFKKLRLSIAVPNLDTTRSIDPIEYLDRMLPTVRNLLKELLRMDVAPIFDCNYPPLCLFTKEDMNMFSKYEKVMSRSNLFNTNAICTPVLDILPDLHVVRCFGMSTVYKVWLPDFHSINELQRHFSAQIDAIAHHIIPSDKCRGCKTYLRMKCSGGCYAYRQRFIKEVNAAIEDQYGGTK